MNPDISIIHEEREVTKTVTELQRVPVGVYIKLTKDEIFYLASLAGIVGISSRQRVFGGNLDGAYDKLTAAREALDDKRYIATWNGQRINTYNLTDWKVYEND